MRHIPRAQARDKARAIGRAKARAQPVELQAPLGTYERYAGLQGIKDKEVLPEQLATSRGYLAWRLAAATCPHELPHPGGKIPLVWPCAECLAWAKVVIEDACVSRLQELSRAPQGPQKATEKPSSKPRTKPRPKRRAGTGPKQSAW